LVIIIAVDVWFFRREYYIRRTNGQMNDYYFNNLGRIGADNTDATQRNLSNTRYANYVLYDYVGGDTRAEHVDFAVQQPTLMFTGVAHGSGLGGSEVQVESDLFFNDRVTRPEHKLSLYSRPFATVPYLGRGWADPSVESQLQQGQNVRDMKSVATIMENSFMSRALYPVDDVPKNDMVMRQSQGQAIDDLVMNGWINGGADSRGLTHDEMKKYKPSNGQY
jgi:hypothetical protein